MIPLMVGEAPVRRTSPVVGARELMVPVVVIVDIAIDSPAPPLVIDKGKVSASCLALNVDQSVDDSFPVFVAEAIGKFKVVVPPELETEKLVPAVPEVFGS